MKVLVIARNFDLPEANVFAAMNRSGIKVTALGSSSSRNFSILQEANVELGNIEFSGRISIRAVKNLKRWFAKSDWDIVHYLDNRALSNGLLAGYHLRAKFVGYRGVMGHLSKWDPTSWMSYLNARLDKIICVCDHVRDYLLEKGVNPDRALTIYKGHDVNWYNASKDKIAPSRQDLGIDQDSVVFNCTARMRPVKGAVYLVRAFKKLRAVRPNVDLLLVGEIACDELRAELDDTGSGIHQLGYRADATDLLYMSDVTALTSIVREGLPKSVIEGMCCGLPSLCTRVGGMNELVVDGKTGFLVNEGDVDAIFEKMLFYVDNQKERLSMGEAARARIVSDFNIEQTVAHTMKLYEELFNKN